MIPQNILIPNYLLSVETDRKYSLKRFLNPAKSKVDFDVLLQQDAQNKPLKVNGRFVTSKSKRAFCAEERLYYGIFEQNGDQEKLIGQVGLHLVDFKYAGVEAETYRPVSGRFNGLEGSLIASHRDVTDLIQRGVVVAAHRVLFDVVQKAGWAKDWAIRADVNSEVGLALYKSMGLGNRVNLFRINDRNVSKICLLTAKIDQTLSLITSHRKPVPVLEQMKRVGRERA